MTWLVVLAVLVLVLLAVTDHDWTLKAHTIRRNFPLVGRFRYWLEAIGPELRQYIVARWRARCLATWSTRPSSPRTASG